MLGFIGFIFSAIWSVVGFIWLIITLGVLYNLWVESTLTTDKKLFWTIGMLIFPFFGPLAWILFGERTGDIAK